ncbi:MAG TPA: hypothetical protein VFU31_22725 [Candidatus Binatia bacterium]|nr:hypothetical protein [Candidatus Binatia bacterium]
MQSVLLVLLYLIAPAQALLPVDDPDIWWHLRTGQWIIENGWVPATDPFSSYGAGRPWVAYSWLFEILVYGLYSKLGLTGLVLFTVIGSLIITAALHLLVRRASLPFTAEVAITAVGLFCLKPVLTPRPWLFSILFFILVSHIVFAARTAGNVRRLYFLPVIFLLWANLHVQFIYGLALLLFLSAEALIGRLFQPGPGSAHTESIPFGRLLTLTILSAAATLLTPYHIHLYYGPIREYAVQTSVFQNIQEFHPMFFRSPEDWLVLALALGATFILGWRRETRLFPYLLLATGTFLAFRARRDVWVLVVAALAILGERQMTATSQDDATFTARRLMPVAAGIILSLVALGYYRNLSETNLTSHVARTFPADAVNFIKNNGEAGPLYNHLDWGGYLIWALPEIPVGMDGRTNLQGEERIERSLATWSGYAGWEVDPELRQARLIIADIHRPLTFLLRTDPRFRLVYRDEVTAVFVANRSETHRGNDSPPRR